MAWSGPPSGVPVAAYQPPPPPAYGQQPYPPSPYGQQPPYAQPYAAPPYSQPHAHAQGHAPNHSSRFPSKRKGSHMNSRHHPQSGYRGHPQNASPSHGQPPAYPPPQGYQAPPSYPPSQPYPPQYYPPPAGYPPPPNYPPPQGYPQTPAYPPAAAYPPPQGWPHPQGYPPQPGYPPPQVYPSQGQAPPDPNAAWPTPGHPPYPYGGYPPPAPPPPPPDVPGENPAPDQSTPRSEKASLSGAQRGEELYLAWDDWDFDFEGALWPKGNDAVDPNLSIGIIIWHPANQVTRALPASFAEAEAQARKKPPPKLGNGESVSKYFTLENSHEAFLDVRQTDEWEKIRFDPIFYEFDTTHDLISMEDVLANRDRPDIPIEDEIPPEDIESPDMDSGWNVMDNLEQALTSGQATIAVRSEEQEDILAKLGVTGSPKPVKPGEGPTAILPPDFGTGRDRSRSPELQPRASERPEPKRVSSHSSYRERDSHGAPPRKSHGSATSFSHPPPPPEPARSPSYDPWNADEPAANGRYDGSRESPARSEASQKTQAGSDFNMETNGKPDEEAERPSSTLNRNDSSNSRKRSWDSSEQDDGRERQYDDVSHRLKRRQPQVAAAYSRRW